MIALAGIMVGMLVGIICRELLAMIAKKSPADPKGKRKPDDRYSHIDL
jgi:F0F1-type ATP synthase membrane subunit c/vacuolar-type H+-ATPase subunit K